MTRRILLLTLFAAFCTSAHANYWRVPGKWSTASSAAVGVVDGDTVEFSSSTPSADAPVWTKNNLVLIGKGVVAFGSATTTDHKGIWKITGNNVTIDNFEFKDVIPQDPLADDSSAAGVYSTGTNLTVRRCWFHDCSVGLASTS